MSVYLWQFVWKIVAVRFRLFNKPQMSFPQLSQVAKIPVDQAGRALNFIEYHSCLTYILSIIEKNRNFSYFKSIATADATYLNSLSAFIQHHLLGAWFHIEFYCGKCLAWNLELGWFMLSKRWIYSWAAFLSLLEWKW